MPTRTDDGSLDEYLTPYQRNGYVVVETEEGRYYLNRNEYEGVEVAIRRKEEFYIGHDPRGLTCLIRLRRGCALVVDSVVDWTAEAIADYNRQIEAEKYRNGES
jgi:hypothetical protein